MSMHVASSQDREKHAAWMYAIKSAAMPESMLNASNPVKAPYPSLTAVVATSRLQKPSTEGVNNVDRRQ